MKLTPEEKAQRKAERLAAPHVSYHELADRERQIYALTKVYLKKSVRPIRWWQQRNRSRSAPTCPEVSLAGGRRNKTLSEINAIATKH